MSANLVLLKFSVKQIDSMTMPEDPGSMLRGAFGHALKSLSEAVMIFKNSNTSGLVNNNEDQAYSTVFEYSSGYAGTLKRGMPNPYVLKLPKLTDRHIEQGQTWEFSQLLIGEDAIQYLSIIILAWSQALSKGIGSTHKRYNVELEKVICGAEVLYQDGQIQVFNKDALVRSLPIESSLIYQQLSSLSKNSDSKLRLNFLTQFRVQHKGKVAYQPEQLDIKSVFYALYNRTNQCHQLHDPGNDWNIGFNDFSEYKNLIETLILSADVKPASLTRYSSRQRRSMTLYGLKGSVRITATSSTLKKLLPLLHLGELLHIGKSTALGLGEYQLQSVNTSSELM